MSTKRHRYTGHNWSVDIMAKPWFIDILTYALVGVWMALTFATIQIYGPGPWLLASAACVLVVGLLMIYGQRLTHLKIGERFELDLRSPGGEDEGTEQWRERNR